MPYFLSMVAGVGELREDAGARSSPSRFYWRPSQLVSNRKTFHLVRMGLALSLRSGAESGRAMPQAGKAPVLVDDASEAFCGIPENPLVRFFRFGSEKLRLVFGLPHA